MRSKYNMNILLAHGSTDDRHGEQLKALADTVSDLLGTEVGVAFLSHDALPSDATVLPLFLGEGKHVREDVPKLADVSGCRMLPSLSEYADQVAELVISEMTHETRRINAMFVLYRFGGFERLAAALYGRAKVCSKHALASLHTEPSVSSVLGHWRQEAVNPITLQAMLLFEGKSMDRLRRMTESFDQPSDVSITPVLSEYDGFAALVANCFRSQS